MQYSDFQFYNEYIKKINKKIILFDVCLKKIYLCALK